MSAWQDISTAVRDGSYIIAARFRNGDELCWVKHSRWVTAAEAAESFGDDPDYYESGWSDGNDNDEPCYPTHWQPLLPPEAESAKAGSQ